MWAARDDRLFIPLAITLIVLAWLTLILWGQSPYGRYLSHDGLEGINLGANPGVLVVFVTGWTVMTAAMMLPTSLPLIVMFRRMSIRRADAAAVIVLLIGGYLAVWTLFGVLVHAVDLVLHQVVASTWLDSRAWIIGSATLVVAGLYQFAPLKYHCLDKCRSPLSFIAARWNGRSARLQAFKLGIHHGAFCVGCCWSLMLVMFAVGVGSIGWMLALGAAMAIEKNMPWGRQISSPLGIVLIGSGALLAMLANVS